MSVFVEDSNDELPPLADSSRGSTEDFPRSNRPHIIISEIEDSDLEITPNSPEPVQATPLNGKSKANTKTAKPAGSSARDSDLDDIIDDDDPYRFTEHSTSSSSTQQRKRPCVTYASTAAKRSRIDTMRSRTAATTPTKQRESSSNLSNQRQKSTDPIWGFVMDNEIKSPEDITESHIRRVYGLTRHSSKPYCPNIRIAETDRTDPDTLLDDSLPPMELKNSSKPKKRGKQSAECTAARCRTNPNCLNHLGFAEWLRPDAFDRFALAQGGLDTDARAAVLSSSREMPAGLKNLAATCYLNSLLQVWFHNAEFRDCIYRYRPSGTGDNWCQEDADSDIVRHLQVIYAQMQYGLRKVVDPTGLVRALKIDSAVQQDAQEFGKLFTALLENLLEGQTDHQVRDVISSQFEGKLCYVTVCKNCKLASSREENFHELELNVSHLDFATVEDCLKAYLSEEVLDHSNQYYCSTCGSKQDAARRIRLKILPKVLNLQLLRFTFDLKTMTKKKKKGLVLFPAVLDASIFSEDSGGNESAGPALYELTAVLMHKGSTAYSGHFVARVAVDGSQGSQWYSFNDENVEVMDSVGFEFEDETKAVAKKLSNVTGHKAKLFIKSESVTESSLFASTCAYMLTYRRCSPRTSAAPIAPEAPPDIQGIVEVDNKAFMHEIETVQQRESQLENQFQQARSVRQAICSYWSVSSNQAECVYLPTSVLRRWMVGPLSVTTPSKMDSPALEVLASDTEDPLTPQECESSSDTQLVCSHGNLSFRSLGELKRVSKKAAHQLLGELGVSVEKVLTTRDLCGQCVKNEVALLLDHSRHEADVEFIKNCILEDTDVLYWVSKPWYIEWKKKRPQHSGLNENCSPAAEPYYSHVYCKHGSLSLDSTQRRLISETAYRYLKKRVFPGWETLMAVKDSREDDLECPTCRAEEAATVEATAGARSQAHAEKSRLRRLVTERVPVNLSKDKPLNLLSTSFLTEWRGFVSCPMEAPRPTAIRNAPLVCETHKLLMVHPLIDAMTAKGTPRAFALVTNEEWDILANFYDTDYTAWAVLAENNGTDSVTTEPAVCGTCRRSWLRELDTFFVTVQNVTDKPKPEASATTESSSSSLFSKPLKGPDTEDAQSPDKRRKLSAAAPTNPILASFLATTTRRSTARSIASISGEFSVTRRTSVLDLKTQICGKWGTVPIHQALRWRRHLSTNGEDGTSADESELVELKENKATMESLGLVAGDTLEVEFLKVDEKLMEEVEASSGSRAVELGFSGTGLVSFTKRPDGPVGTTHYDDLLGSSTSAVSEKACKACTFINEPGRVVCDVCEGMLE